MYAFPPNILELTSTQIQNCCGYTINHSVLPGFRIEVVQSQIEKLEKTLVAMNNNLFTDSLVTVIEIVLTVGIRSVLVFHFEFILGNKNKKIY